MDFSHIINELGEEREEYFNSVAPPITQTSNFAFNTVNDIRKAFQDKYRNNLYTRGNNPTTNILRKKLAALEHADDALIVGSGTAAIMLSIFSNVKSGDHVICVANPYGWTHHILADVLPRFNVTTTFIDGTDNQNFLDSLQENTTVIMLESPNSFTYEIQDLEFVANLCKEKNITSIIDNSYSTPIFQNPLDFGIDIVVHSASKYIGGHSDVVAGIVCSSEERIEAMFNSEYMSLGAIISPFDSWLMIRGLRTMKIRYLQAGENAQKMIEYLENHPKVGEILYPFYPKFPQYKLAKKQMKAAGGLFSFYLKTSDLEKVDAFANALKRFSIAVSWGGHESIVLPASAFYKDTETTKSSYKFNLVRMYTGLEDFEDLRSDVEQALEKV